jgi:Tol biopolymer transport system component/DNA-binding winged helix-turn-helix (wHTH) protein
MGLQPNHFYEFGPFRLHVAERLLLRDGEIVALTPKAFDLLLALVEHHGQLLEKGELMKAVWPDTFVEEGNLSWHVSHLRKALGDGENGRHYIDTVPKRGYRFVAGVVERRDEGTEQRMPEQTEANVVSATTPTAPPHLVRRLIRPAVFVAVPLVIGVSVWLTVFRRSPELPPPKIVPLTALRGNELRPSFSPDGNQIAFAWDGEKEDNQDIYVKQLGNESLRRLTTNPAADAKPCWSPDGRYIAFARELPEGVELYVIPSLGGAERRIMQPSSSAMIDRYQISWSPDSAWLAVSDQGSIFLVARDTGAKRKLTAPPAIPNGDGYPAISPDGKTVAFFRNYDLYLVPTAGGEPKLLVSNTTRSKSPAWTPDGREILFLSTRSDDSSLSLWRVPATGGTPEQVVAAGQNLHSFAVSRDGQRLALTQGITISDQNIWRMELTGRAASPRQTPQSAKVLISSTKGEGGGQISPDGKKIVFSSYRSGNHEIWVADSTGERQVQLTTFNRDVTGSPRWSPDGRQIVFDSRAEGNADIYVISAEGGQPRRLTTDPAEEVTPSWSRDGNSIYFCSTRGGIRDIWKMPATGGEAVRITRQSEAYQCVESPDRRFLYYQKSRFMAGIWRVPVAGGAETLVLDHHRAGYWRQWTVVEQGIYFATAERPEQPLIEFFSFGAGRVTPVATLQGRFNIGSSGLSVAPDGRWLIWSQIDQIGHDIMLMENFRTKRKAVIQRTLILSAFAALPSTVIATSISPRPARLRAKRRLT